MSKPNFLENQRTPCNISKTTTPDVFELDKNTTEGLSQNASKHKILTPPSSPLVLMELSPEHSSCNITRTVRPAGKDLYGIGTVTTELLSLEGKPLSPESKPQSNLNSPSLKYKSPKYQYFAPELLYKILSYLSSSQASLHACVLVCKPWSFIACTILWRQPLFTSLNSVEKFTSVLDIDITSYLELRPPSPLNHITSSKNSTSFATSTSSISLISTGNHFKCWNPSGYFNNGLLPTTTRCYGSLVRKLDFTQLDEVHRNSAILSQFLVRLIPIVRVNLQCLDLGFSKGVRNFDLQRLSPWLSNLTSLNLAGGGRTDMVLTKLSKHCPKLTRLSVSWNSQLTDFGFVEMARNCRELRALDLTNCTQISDTGIMALAVYCTQLKVLNISYCQCVGEVAIWELVRSCKQLKLLNVLGCINLSRRFPEKLQARYPELLVNVPGVLPFYYSDIS